jgi:hypothetical protein
VKAQRLGFDKLSTVQQWMSELEDRAERLRHHLRRPTLSSPSVTNNPSYTTRLTDPRLGGCRRGGRGGRSSAMLLSHLQEPASLAPEAPVEEPALDTKDVRAAGPGKVILSGRYGLALRCLGGRGPGCARGRLRLGSSASGTSARSCGTCARGARCPTWTTTSTVRPGPVRTTWRPWPPASPRGAREGHDRRPTRPQDRRAPLGRGGGQPNRSRRSVTPCFSSATVRIGY